MSLFSLGKLRSRLSLFSRELGRSSAAGGGSGPAAAEAVRRLRSRRSQMELANESEKGIFHISSNVYLISTLKTIQCYFTFYYSVSVPEYYC